MAQKQPHFLLVTYPAQGHINPTLKFAKRLMRIGACVTFATKIKRRGSQIVTDLILASEKEGHPFTCLVYTLLLRWAAVVAHRLNLPLALLWIQPAMVFDVYYYYFYGYGNMIKQNAKKGSCLIELPELPSLSSCDLPSFLLPSYKYPHALESFQEQMEALHEESNPKILVNTFDALESEALIAIDKFNIIAIGPLIPSAFLDGKDPSDTSFGLDLFLYVSFGSLIVLEKQQMEEIARGLLGSAHPFLWVIRENQNEEEDMEEDKLMSCRSREELEQQGMIVPWCSQVEVLSNPAIRCFVTHCGWNSMLESLACSVPLVAFPQWMDQATNAKLIEDIWKTGDEIKRCLELVMGEGAKREELRENAKKLRDLAREATNEGGSLDTNLKAFVVMWLLICHGGSQLKC
ncbi:hypothetical protein Patl1_26163 [Pistacia atlantica]|uniref:Uncharacterized protein n=1 Tax=Pistacia atlantica TaxID=434234 RepID=A0ACC1B4U3_9ROSI|nr:hypothetical protein Patl1_26163 [Pistacia atlantica]